MKNSRCLFAFCILTLFFFGCASFTGVMNWKEETCASSLDREGTTKIAVQALAHIGKVSFSDLAAGTVSGEYGEKVEVAILVFEKEGKILISVKAKLDVKGNEMVIETGDRKKCIDHIVEEMKSLGCTLSPILPAS